jgi:hypothetical protein
MRSAWGCANLAPLIQKHHHRCLADHMREFGRVPVGEADAAVRLGLADRLRMRRAVDAVGCLCEVDPHGADRIVGPLRDLDLLLGLDALEGEFRIIGIGITAKLDCQCRRWVKFDRSTMSSRRRRSEASSTCSGFPFPHIRHDDVLYLGGIEAKLFHAVDQHSTHATSTESFVPPQQQQLIVLYAQLIALLQK